MCSSGPAVWWSKWLLWRKWWTFLWWVIKVLLWHSYWINNLSEPLLLLVHILGLCTYYLLLQNKRDPTLSGFNNHLSWIMYLWVVWDVTDLGWPHWVALLQLVGSPEFGYSQVGVRSTPCGFFPHWPSGLAREVLEAKEEGAKITRSLLSCGLGTGTPSLVSYSISQIKSYSWGHSQGARQFILNSLGS